MYMVSSILIEYGWGDPESLAQLIDTTNARTIVKQAADENLNYDIKKIIYKK